MGFSDDANHDSRGQDESRREMRILRSRSGSEDQSLKIGEAVPATPEDAEKFKRALEEIERDPAKYAGYGWVGAGKRIQ